MASRMNEDESTPPLEPTNQTALESLFTNLPNAYEDRQAALEQLRAAFQAQVASALRGHFWEHVKAQPQSTPADRLSLITAMQERLERLGLSMVEPKLNRRGVLVNDGTSPATQRGAPYQFWVHDNLGNRELAEEYQELPKLELLADGPLLIDL